MRALLISWEYPPVIEGGLGRHVRKLSERLVRELASLRFVQTATNVVLLGPPGVGKTHLASALALAGMEAGYSALFTTLSQLAAALEAPAGRGGGPSRRLRASFAASRQAYVCPP